MADYLTPGVYIEEFDSGGVPLEGAGTSTAGFIGLAQRGDTKGLPQLVTSFADFARMYGTHLSRKDFGEYRYLAYAVDHFFANGGSRCFIMRVAPSDAKPSQTSLENVMIDEDSKTTFTVAAKNEGVWGNQIKVTFRPSSKNRTFITGKEDTGKPEDNVYKVARTSGFTVGDVVATVINGVLAYNRIESFPTEDTMKLKKAFAKADEDLELAKLAWEDDYKKDLKVYKEKKKEFDKALKAWEKDQDGTKPAEPVNPEAQITLISCEFTLEASFREEYERFEHLSLNPAASSYIGNGLSKANLIVVNASEDGPEQADKALTDILHPFIALTVDDAAKQGAANAALKFELKNDPISDSFASYMLAGGDDGSIANVTADVFMGEDEGPGERTGIKSFIDNDEVAIMAIPGVVDPAVQLALVAHCENLRSRFAILDLPLDSKKIDDILEHRNYFDTQFAALYGPWLQVYDPVEKRNIFIPPAGSMAGIYARSDNTRGVHKAPANEVVRNCVGLSCQYNDGEQASLNPRGINVIRAFTGQGIRVWGARTLSSNGLWKYINVRRLYIFLEESVRRGTNWVVFEPNDEKLWARVHRTIDAFLTRVWRDGALVGASPAEAFYINIGRSTMTQDDIDNGRLICVIGVAAVKPAEFVIFRFTQKTSEQ